MPSVRIEPIYLHWFLTGGPKRKTDIILDWASYYWGEYKDSGEPIDRFIGDYVDNKQEYIKDAYNLVNKNLDKIEDWFKS